MKNKVLHTVFSIVLTITILLPFTIQMVHTLNGHEHIVCNLNEVEHIDQHQLDCGDYHQIIEINSTGQSFDLNLTEPVFFAQLSTNYSQCQIGIQLNQKSSRAPPFFII